MNNRIIQLHPHPATPGWMVQSDFDGTISVLDVTDTLLNRFGQPGWQELEDAWERGEIGSRECMKGQVALLDMSEAELRAHLDTIQIDPGFVGFVDIARTHGITVQVVSDGIDYAIRHVLARHCLGHLEVIANRLVQTGERSWRLDSPWASARCQRASGNCKCERLAEQQNLHGRVLYVGDSTSDFCVSHMADFVLAKYKLIAHCEQHGISHAPFETFTQATTLLEKVALGLEVLA
ncbi:MtnX-like HAD-IB family phosphatase [Diaphorobacter sp. HDW4A]|uniref:MtnX-like HAD-IB family phosphatase n=1 Tax=Diaphorobacter sp. HDW4A TaxID=2714924 RepID=UPI0014073759|nr:MtnX-like HAD-IB family phosphatase [Diaphorobacter sp. HDW4A]QIL82659.1 MtnX-like HAD-IB family phosphatase [Diaphorobacter sp. HDW4A]